MTWFICEQVNSDIPTPQRDAIHSGNPETFSPHDFFLAQFLVEVHRSHRKIIITQTIYCYYWNVYDDNLMRHNIVLGEIVCPKRKDSPKKCPSVPKPELPMFDVKTTSVHWHNICHWKIFASDRNFSLLWLIELFWVSLAKWFYETSTICCANGHQLTLLPLRSPSSHSKEDSIWLLMASLTTTIKA